MFEKYSHIFAKTAKTELLESPQMLLEKFE